MASVVIHAEPSIPWQKAKVHHFVEGMKRLGFEVTTTNCRQRISDAPAILFGTTFWREIEQGKNWLLVDRCSFGPTEDYVSLVWDGHGQRGDHCVPSGYDGSRWAKHGVPIEDYRGDREGPVVLCGQSEPYSPDWVSMGDWYSYRRKDATHFRSHPASSNPTSLPNHSGWDVGSAITLNSSVAVEFLSRGIPTIVDDAGGMAYGWERFGSTEEWFKWLAWTQWGWNEIEDGLPHLFDSHT